MTIGTEEGDGSEVVAPASLVDALLVYAEPLASGAHAVVIGDAETTIIERLLDLGARSVHVFDPDPERAAHAARTAARGVTIRALGSDFDVRDGTFDLAVVPDLAELVDPTPVIARLGRAVAGAGAVVAMGRARLAEAIDDERIPFEEDLGPASLAYDELYDLFAGNFHDVALVGVVPFQGVVFAELGGEDATPVVSVDTRLAAAEAPSVFVVVASDGPRRPERTLDPYAIVQLSAQPGLSPETTDVLESALAAAQLKAELVGAQLEEMRERVVVADVRIVEASARLDRASIERDAALTRAMELEAVLAAAQQTLTTVERRLLEAEQGMLERDDRIAALSAELDSRLSQEAALPSVNVAELEARAERAEAALAASAAETSHLGEAHAAETMRFEEQLAERARVIASLEKELVRREQLVKELVSSLEESRDVEGGAASGRVFEAPVDIMPSKAPPALEGEVARLRTKLDELATEVARREGELVARAWRITELENERARLLEEPEAALARAQGEIDALRQALAQEHAARMAVESGDELARARSELARQAVLLEQMRGRAETS